ncbi:hypothetical protein D770_05880 [Flammeovirgaceae bacterium 311]|nr:hypothetical protein D770_05880 [Flammeovirgaceae bacterium 311]
MIIRNTILIFFLAGLLATACSRTPGAQAEAAAGADFSDYTSYAYLPTGDTASNFLEFDESVIQEVNEEMQARGYRLNRENPDLLVLVNYMYQRDTATTRTPIFSRYDYYRPDIAAPPTLEEYYYARYNTITSVQGSNIREVEYSEGTFVIDVIDASNNQIIWRGWSHSAIDPAALQATIDSYVRNIFEKFPVPPGE